MNNHLKNILGEMFSRVNVIPNNLEEYISKDSWNTQNEWTKKEADDFVLWLIDYLKNKEAFESLTKMSFSKVNRHIVACKFEQKYGWKIKN